MLTIDDIEIKIKKYDRERQVVIVNLLVCETFEVRGWRARYGTTKYSPKYPVWIVSPPSVRVGRNYFWVIEVKDTDLWKELEKWIIQEVKAYTSLSI